MPDSIIFSSIHSTCTNVVVLKGGIEIHKSVDESGFSSIIAVGSALTAQKMGEYADPKILQIAIKVL